MPFPWVLVLFCGAVAAGYLWGRVDGRQHAGAMIQEWADREAQKGRMDEPTWKRFHWVANFLTYGRTKP